MRSELGRKNLISLIQLGLDWLLFFNCVILAISLRNLICVRRSLSETSNLLIFCLAKEELPWCLEKTQDYSWLFIFSLMNSPCERLNKWNASPAWMIQHPSKLRFLAISTFHQKVTRSLNASEPSEVSEGRSLILDVWMLVTPILPIVSYPLTSNWMDII